MTFVSADRLGLILLSIALWGLAGGLAALVMGRADLAEWLWTAGVVPVLIALAVEILRSLWRGDVGLDIVAALSMSAALFFGETLAASVVALMYSGGTFLENFAEGRARHDMQDLLSRVPRTAVRHRNGGLEDVPLDDIAPGDRLLIRQGDVVPVDGTAASAFAFVDTSALTGESLPQRLAMGDGVMSGSTNAGEAFDIVATHGAKDSTYAGIVRLVTEAQRSKAPMARLADQWSLGFLVVTVVIAFAAWWFTGDPIRAVAVLVVATPCPLILAVPVALVAGLSRAAHFGVLIKGAKPLEAMARVRTLILDKTGTLTDGRPRIVSINSCAGMAEEDLLRFAAALDQASQHPVAQAVVAAARAKGLVLPVPTDVKEFPGEGVSGRIDGHDVVVGGEKFVSARVGGGAGGTPDLAAGAVVVALAADGRMAGYLIMADALRDDAKAMILGLRQHGVARILLATGDREAVARHITTGLGLDALHSDLTPDQKVGLVVAERATGAVMMVGDGVNDAPALAVADVGVAMGVRGAAASAEAADVVLLVDRIDRLGQGLQIARQSRGIALQSVVLGIGLSVIGMMAAAFGYLTPVQGAILQEVIDVGVILNALRALRIVPDGLPAKARQGTSGHPGLQGRA